MAAAFIPNGNCYFANIAAGVVFTANISSTTPTNQWLVNSISGGPVALKFSSNLAKSTLSPTVAPGASGEQEGTIISGSTTNQIIGLENGDTSDGSLFVKTVRLVAQSPVNSYIVITPIVPRGNG